jgi:CRISPR-associated protein Cas6
MIDVLFDVSGDTIPSSYPFSLWESLVKHAPVLGSDQSVGVMALRTSVSDAGMLIPKRAKLTLRLPVALSTQVSSLSGLDIDIEGRKIQLGGHKLRPILAFPTLHSHLVNTDEDELDFLEEVSTRLAEFGINGKLICGLRNQLASTEQKITGFSLVVHDLKPEASIRLQYTGLGAARRYGCGIFVPYKVITDLG